MVWRGLLQGGKPLNICDFLGDLEYPLSDFIQSLSCLQDNTVGTIVNLFPFIYEMYVINTAINLFGGHFSCWKYFMLQGALISRIIWISSTLTDNSFISTSELYGGSELKLCLRTFDILDVKITNSCKLFSGWFVCLYFV